jgi:hypothetical protein
MAATYQLCLPCCPGAQDDGVFYFFGASSMSSGVISGKHFCKLVWVLTGAAPSWGTLTVVRT